MWLVGFFPHFTIFDKSPGRVRRRSAEVALVSARLRGTRGGEDTFSFSTFGTGMHIFAVKTRAHITKVYLRLQSPHKTRFHAQSRTNTVGSPHLTPHRNCRTGYSISPQTYPRPRLPRRRRGSHKRAKPARRPPLQCSACPFQPASALLSFPFRKLANVRNVPEHRSGPSRSERCGTVNGMRFYG